MTSRFERRVVATEFEVRSAGDTVTVEGYALKFDVRSGNLGGFRERVAEGATAKTIGEADIRALFNHEPSKIMARSKSGEGTLKLSNDDTGTFYEFTADARQSYVRDLQIAMERGDVTQSSFGFKVVGPDGQSWDEDEDGFPLRTLREIQLFDVSPVTYPAYEDSTSGLAGRSALEQLAEKRGLPFEVVRDNLKGVIDGSLTPGEEAGTASHRSTGAGLVIPDIEDDLDLRVRMMRLKF